MSRFPEGTGGIIWNGCMGKKKPKAILSICPRVHFEVDEYPTEAQRYAQEEILGFKWTVLKKEKEKTMRLMDEIEQELEQVELSLRWAVNDSRTKQWKGYCDALKWVLLYPPKWEGK